MAFELLGGRPPFEGGRAELLDSHINDTPPALKEVAPSISEALSDVIATALAKQPADRHSDVRTFVRAAAAQAGESFDRSEQLSRSVAEAAVPEAAAEAMLSLDLSDATISHLTDLDRTDIVRLRRKAARRALVGRDDEGVRDRRPR